MAEKLPYSKIVENHVLKCVRGGVSKRDTLASMQHLQDAPSSMTTFYKHYGKLWHEEHTGIMSLIGSRVYDQAINGDAKDSATYKSQELALRAKAGWSPQNTVNEVEQETDPELDVSAADQLMNLLGFDPDDEQEDNS
tara:strand:+ start:382 stop:795 length:414 start_codon:yes stop_codon:yes gene_type:complete